MAKATESGALEDLGRATLRIVHDLKNQLNGLKLYATFLRKRLERENSSAEERETVAKLIAGLDRAARDMTMLVRYALPIELRSRPQTDLGKIILSAAREEVSRVSGSLSEPVPCEIDSESLVGVFDPNLLAEAFSALTHEALGTGGSKAAAPLLIHAGAAGNETSEALIEWQGSRARIADTVFASGNAYSAFASNVIAAHGGRLEIAPGTIRVWLPLSK